MEEATRMDPATIADDLNEVTVLVNVAHRMLLSIRDDVEALRDIGRSLRRHFGVAEDRRIEHAEDRRLLDDLAVVARMQAVDQRAHGARLLDELLQIRAGAMIARMGGEHRVLDAGADEIFL